ncbi:MAG: mevalonate kinase [Candidatus Saliniplasma sp.]
MVKCSAPGKVILFGEHAVVYGEPAISLAVDKRITCAIEKGEGVTTVNGYEIDEKHQGYIMKAIEKSGFDSPLKIKTDSGIPSGAGLGSSAAVTVASLGSLEKMDGVLDEEKVARNSFEIEYEVQGSASPIDTSTSTHGCGIMVSKEKGENFLWNISKNDKKWNIHHRDIPDIPLVVGDTGVHAPTGPLVDKVRRFYDKSNFAKEIVREIGQLVYEGSSALEDGDLEKVGRLMNENHRLLSILGVNHPKLDSLVEGAKRHSYGAKMTGAGGGGSMVAITDEPEEVAEVIKKRGGEPYILKPTKVGLRVEDTSF